MWRVGWILREGKKGFSALCTHKSANWRTWWLVYSTVAAICCCICISPPPPPHTYVDLWLHWILSRICDDTVEACVLPLTLHIGSSRKFMLSKSRHFFFPNNRGSSYYRSCETSFLDSGLASPKTVSLSRPRWKFETILFCHLDNLIIFVSFPVLCHVTNAVEWFFTWREKEIERYRCRWHCIFVVRQTFVPTCYQFSAHKKKFSVIVAGLVYSP